VSLTEKYPSRVVRRLLDLRRSLLYRTPTVSPANEADLRAALLRLIANDKVYHTSTPAASAGRGVQFLSCAALVFRARRASTGRRTALACAAGAVLAP
jgi:hypothetical protein